MVIVFLFLLGVANFAAHKAVLESGHPLLAQMPRFFRRDGWRPSLLLEFAVLLGTMGLADAAEPAAARAWALFYALYSAVNLVMAWLIVRHRV